MKFVINFGVGTFHQPACSHVTEGAIGVRSKEEDDLPIIEIAYEQVLNLIQHPWSYAKACTVCLPLMKLEARGFVKRKNKATAAEIAWAAGTQAAFTEASNGDERRLVSVTEEIKLELGLTRLQQSLRREE